jgi:ribosomal protein S18 acetylase RimI-like enzyme
MSETQAQAQVLPGDAPDAEVVAALERNWRACVREFGHAPATHMRDDDELFWYVTGLPDAAFNSVMYANLAPDRIDAAVDEIVSLRRQHRVPMNWLIGPTSRPTNLPSQLRARGFHYIADLVPLTLKLADLRPGISPRAVLTVERVESTSALEEWIAAESRGFELVGELDRGIATLRRGMGVGDNRLRTHLLGRVDGEPVATASVVLAGGIGGIYDVSTVPEVRQRGIGTAMTRAALDVIRAAGHQMAFLQASVMGKNLYHRLGFRDRCVCAVYG